MLKTVREKNIEAGWTRRNINKNICQIRSVFRRGAENGLAPESTRSAGDTRNGQHDGDGLAPDRHAAKLPLARPAEHHLPRPTRRTPTRLLRLRQTHHQPSVNNLRPLVPVAPVTLTELLLAPIVRNRNRNHSIGVVVCSISASDGDRVDSP